MRARSIRIGISSCLLGENVRYNGGHKRHRYIVETLARRVELVPICPEVAIGLGVPRAPIHLVRRGKRLRAVGVEDAHLDVTEALARFGETTARALADISGYIFKARSPSCGLRDVAVEADVRGVRGVYADSFLLVQDCLPTVDETGLDDPSGRDNFLERVFAYHRWQELRMGRFKTADLAQFHAIHELALFAHDPRSVTGLRQLVTQAGPIEIRAELYIAKFMQTLSRPATSIRHGKVLSRMMGYLKKHLEHKYTTELLECIQRYRAGRVSRASVLRLLRRHFKQHPDIRVVQQTYLYPCTEEKALRQL